MNIYVGNLSFETSEDDLRRVFEEFGQVANVTILKDKFSGKSRGFGFVEMPSSEEGQAAVTGLDGKEIQGRALKVNEARPKAEQTDDGGGRRI
ncbi:MAG: RNA-binding protein [candidate division Zixibacteria bacterium]|nr:RNA-binding protein [candidate division Zixibacteria bacterium]